MFFKFGVNRPCDRKLLDEVATLFHQISRAYRNRDEIDGYVAFENNFDSILAMSIGKMLVASEIANRENLKPLVINERKCEENIKLYDALDIKNEITLTNFIGHPCCFVKGIVSAFFSTVKHPSPEELIKKEYGGILVGDLIYDMWVREHDEIYTLEKIEPLGEAFKRTAKAFVLVDIVKKIFKKYTIKYLLVGNSIYTDAVFCRIAQKMNIEMINYSNERELFLYTKDENIVNSSTQYHNQVEKYLEIHDITKTAIEQNLADTYGGKGDWNNKNAFLNKKIDDRQHLMERLGLDIRKKNVVIMAHCFSDAPHCNGKLLYRDYYEELEKTLLFADSLTNVNWILKPHPCRNAYHEEGVVEDLFQRCCPRGNVKWMPDEYSAAVLKDFADLLITIQGTAAIEFACVGVPSIVTAKPYFDGFGFTIKVNSREELFEKMENAGNISRLTEQQKDKAQIVLYAFNQIYKESQDPVVEIIRKGYQHFRKTKNELESNDLVLKLLKENLTEEMLKQSEWIANALNK